MINTHDTIHDENHPKWLRQVALKALAVAKKQEAEKLKGGATYKRINDRTIILKTKS